MSAALNKAVLTISVDLECDVADTRLARQCPPEATADQLLEIFARYELPATWSLGDPTIAGPTERIASHHAGHEIALAGDASWVGDDFRDDLLVFGQCVDEGLSVGLDKGFPQLVGEHLAECRLAGGGRADEDDVHGGHCSGGRGAMVEV